MDGKKDVNMEMQSLTREGVKKILSSLPNSQARALEMLVDGLPSETNLLKSLIRMAKTQFRYSFGQKKKVAIIGPANVGKSTLFNQFIQEKKDIAKVSPIPGTTITRQDADSGLFIIVDTPGADAIGSTGMDQHMEAVSTATQADFLIILFDAVQGIKQTELDLFHQFKNLKKPFIVALNKIDLVKSDVEQVIKVAASNLGIDTDELIPVSAKNGENLSQLFLAIASIEPEMIAALGQALPQYRWQLAWKTIGSAASISAVIALTPLPIIDFAPLIITQSTMVLGIARIYNYKINLQRAKELIATFGLGLLGRTLFMELSKLGGIPGWLLASTIAASTTIVMGYAASRWFESGEKLSTQSLKTLTQNLTKLLIASIKKIGKPRKKEIREPIMSTLENSEFSQDRSAFEQQIGEE